MAFEISYYLACFGTIWYTAMVLLSLTGAIIARRRYRPQPRSELAAASHDTLPGVSILRPLMGLDCNLYENLEASFVQDWPREKMEIIFSVAKEDDQAVPIVKELMERFPEVDARLIIGEENVGVNPKINNLIRSYREAKYDILWIVDSNTLVLPCTLSHSVALLTTPPKPGQKPIGLVHHVPFAILPSDDLGSRVEQAFLNGTHARMYLGINATRIDSCLMGKSNLFRRSDLEKATAKRLARKGTFLSQPTNADGSKRVGQFDALEAYGKFLGEDNMIGHTLWHELGATHEMTGDVAGNAVGFMDLKGYFWRRVRWIRVRKYMATSSTLATLAEPFTESLVLSLVISASLYRLFSVSPFLLVPLSELLFLSIDTTTSLSLLRVTPNPLAHHAVAHDAPISFAFVRAWGIRELLALPIWTYAMLGDRIGWREGGKQYRVTVSGEVEVVRDDEREGWTERVLARVMPSLLGKERRGRRGYEEISGSDIAE